MNDCSPSTATAVLKVRQERSAAVAVVATVCCAAVAIQSIVVGLVGLVIPFVALALLLTFYVWLLYRRHRMGVHIQSTIGLASVGAIATLLSFAVLVIWIRDTVLLLRRTAPHFRPTAGEAATSSNGAATLLAKVDRTLFPSPTLCLWGCRAHSSEIRHWNELQATCKIGHITHGTLISSATIAALIVVIMSVQVILLNIKYRRRRQQMALNPPFADEKLFTTICIQHNY